MIPAAALLGRHLDDAMRQALDPIRPEEVTIRFFPFPRWRGWPRTVAAMTMPWGVYLRPEALAADDVAVRRLVVHELVHARQWRTLGTVGFLRRYLGEYLGHRLRGSGHTEAYRAISLEREAYSIAAAVTG